MIEVGKTALGLVHETEHSNCQQSISLNVAHSIVSTPSLSNVSLSCLFWRDGIDNVVRAHLLGEAMYQSLSKSPSNDLPLNNNYIETTGLIREIELQLTISSI